MPIDLKPIWEKGWDRNHEHTASDPVFCMSFIDAKTGRTLFKYAAKLNDLSIWVKYFAELGTYEKNKKICPDTDLEKTTKDD